MPSVINHCIILLPTRTVVICKSHYQLPNTARDNSLEFYNEHLRWLPIALILLFGFYRSELQAGGCGYLSSNSAIN
ncbi:hypothetical protein SK128_023545 [Halocaridina rubra]|uniref:Uncharacterized protein n=1 Tax=Halocaridina rubra TaxID=373956 RepID=A0AAN8XPL0_HALRR